MGVKVQIRIFCIHTVSSRSVNRTRLFTIVRISIANRTCESARHTVNLLFTCDLAGKICVCGLSACTCWAITLPMSFSSFLFTPRLVLIGECPCNYHCKLHQYSLPTLYFKRFQSNDLKSCCNCIINRPMDCLNETRAGSTLSKVR